MGNLSLLDHHPFRLRKSENEGIIPDLLQRFVDFSLEGHLTCYKARGELLELGFFVPTWTRSSLLAYSRDEERDEIRIEKGPHQSLVPQE